MLQLGLVFGLNLLNGSFIKQNKGENMKITAKRVGSVIELKTESTSSRVLLDFAPAVIKVFNGCPCLFFMRKNFIIVRVNFGKVIK